MNDDPDPQQQVRDTWDVLESKGFPPESAGWPFITPDLPSAVEATLEALIGQRDDLLEEVLKHRARG